MTYSLLPEIADIPFPQSVIGGASMAGAGSVFLLDAAAEKCALIFRANVDHAAGTLDKLIFHTGTIAGTATVDIRIETVDGATAAPTGTLAWAGATASQGTLVSATSYEVTLATPDTFTPGTVYAIVFVYNAGTTINIGAAFGMSGTHYPYAAHFTGTWALSSTMPVVALRVNGVYIPAYYAAAPARFSGIQANSSTTPDERGNRFTLPFKMRTIGFLIYYQVSNAAADFDLVLYDAANTIIESISVDASQQRGTTGGVQIFPFTTKRDIEANTIYRVVIKPTTATASSGTLIEWFCLNAEQMAAMPGRGAWIMTQRTDGGAWTDTTTKLCAVGLQFDAQDIERRVNAVGRVAAYP